jgi:hypothetical protein
MSPTGRLALLLVALSIAATAATSATSKPPERLNAADGRLAKRLTIHLSDLPAGWRVEKIPNSGSGKCSAPDFPNGVTVSGKAKTSFSMSQTDLALSLGGVLTRSAAPKPSLPSRGVAPDEAPPGSSRSAISSSCKSKLQDFEIQSLTDHSPGRA